MQQQADEVLESIKQRRMGRACYPCAKRKIRCSGGQPCTTCVARGHPDICFSTAGQNRNKRARKAASQTHRERETSSEASHQATRTQPAGLNYNEPQSVASSATLNTTLGANSVPNFLHDTLGERVDNVWTDLGLGSAQTWPLCLLSSIKDLGAACAELRTISPTRSELLKYLPSFRSDVVPLSPVIVHPDAFELWAFAIVDRPAPATGGELRKQAAELSLVLMALVLGYQFANGASASPSPVLTDLAERSFRCIQLSGCPFVAEIETVQTMLLLSQFLQNTGQSDAAWLLLGLTMRMAQTLGLHQAEDEPAYALWRGILWQDILLSMRFDRSPMFIGIQPPTMPRIDAIRACETYCEAMYAMNDLGRPWQSLPDSDKRNPTLIFTYTETLNAIIAAFASRLVSEEECSSLEQRMQCLALRMHSSFTAAEMCRPFLTRNRDEDDLWQELRERGINAMMSTIQAYLDLSQTTLVPLRSWSLTHEAMCCACVLALLQPNPLQDKVRCLLDSIEALLEGDENGSADYPVPRICETWSAKKGITLLRHVRARGKTHAQNQNAQREVIQEQPLSDQQLATDDWFNNLEMGLDFPLASFFDHTAELFPGLDMA